MLRTSKLSPLSSGTEGATTSTVNSTASNATSPPSSANRTRAAKDLNYNGSSKPPKPCKPRPPCSTMFATSPLPDTRPSPGSPGHRPPGPNRIRWPRRHPRRRRFPQGQGQPQNQAIRNPDAHRVFSGGQGYRGRIFDFGRALKRPTMVLACSAYQGADAIAMAWARNRKVDLVKVRPTSNTASAPGSSATATCSTSARHRRCRRQGVRRPGRF